MVNTLSHKLNDISLETYVGFQEYITGSDIRSVALSKRNRIDNSEDSDKVKLLKSHFSRVNEFGSYVMRATPIILGALAVRHYVDTDTITLLPAVSGILAFNFDAIQSIRRNGSERMEKKLENFLEQIQEGSKENAHYLENISRRLDAIGRTPYERNPLSTSKS